MEATKDITPKHKMSDNSDLDKNKPGLIINYFDRESNKSCLEGLSIKEKQVFQSIVLKQYERGIKIRVNYEEVDFITSSLAEV